MGISMIMQILLMMKQRKKEKNFKEQMGHRLFLSQLEGKDIREVAFDTFNFYHLGDEDKDNGVLFITEAKGNHDYYMEVGTGLEGSLTEIRSSHLQKE